MGEIINKDDYAWGYDQGYADGHEDGYQRGYTECSQEYETRIGRLYAELQELNARIAVLERHTF